MRQKFTPLVLFGALGMLAKADSLTIAAQYNIFVFNALNDSNNGISGSAAVGGTSIFASTNAAGSIVGGGPVTVTNSTIAGDITSGGTVSVTTSSISGAVNQNQSSLPVNFGQVQNDLTADSLDWSTLAATGSYTDSFSTITLNGGDAGLDVFDVSGSDLGGANSLVFSSSIPSTATVIINVTGTSDQMANLGFTRNNVQTQNIIFNFYQATGLTASSLGIDGSVLAPLATVNFSNGHIDGNLFVKNLTMSAQSNSKVSDSPGSGSNALFKGNVPSAAPEPSSLALLGFGGLLIVVGTLRTQRR